MLPGDLSIGEVAAFVSRIEVNGVTRPHESVSVSAEMRSDLPSQLSKSSGSIGRSGSVTWRYSQTVETRPVTPFNDFGAWRPKRGDKVVVYEGDGTSEWVRFTGLVDETTGGPDEPLKSEIVGDVDPLSTSFSHEAMLSVMPPLNEGGPWRNVGLTPFYYMDAALRTCGYNATPPNEGNSLLSVPMQGSMLHEAGTNGQYLSGGSASGASSFATLWPAPWGLSVANVQARYVPRLALSTSEPVQLTVMMAPAHSETSYVDLRYGSNILRLLLGSQRSAVVQTIVGGTTTEVCRLTPAQNSDATIFTVLKKGSSVTVRNDSGDSAAGTAPSLGSTAMTYIDVVANVGSRIAGLQVTNPEPWQEFVSLSFTPTARYELSGATSELLWGIINAAPRVEEAEAQSVIESLADAMLAGAWMDESGVIVVQPSNLLRGATAVQSITTRDDVLSFAWSDRLLATASRVTVNYRHPNRKSALRQTIEVARGSNQTLEAGGQYEDVYTPAGEDDWIGVDETFTILSANQWGLYNGGVGSFAGVTYTNESNPVGNSSGYNTDITMTKTGLSEYTVTHQPGNLPSGIVAETTTHPTSSDLWVRLRDKPLPVIRAYASLTWMDRATTQQVPANLGPTLSVNAGGWVTQPIAVNIRQYLVSLMNAPQAQITSLSVFPDPRRQLGDVILIRSEKYLGVTIRGLVTGISEEHGSEYSQTLTVDVLAVTINATTWEAWEAAYPNTLTYAQWRILQNLADTYDDFNENPLKGA